MIDVRRFNGHGMAIANFKPENKINKVFYIDIKHYQKKFLPNFT